MDDDALIAAIAQDDDLALKELFNRHAPWLAARLRSTLPRDAVEDVLQETFLAVWTRAGSYSGTGSVGAWLWGIARRQAALWLRKHRYVEPPRIATFDENPATTAMIRADLQRALTELGPEGSPPRTLFQLIYVEDRPVSEVARCLGIPEGTVKSRLFTIRRKLRAVLRQEEGT